MSAIFDIEYYSIAYQPVRYRVEIDRDLNMRFLGYDIDYDLSMVEFGEQKTPAIEFLDLWKSSPYSTIVRFFKISGDMKELFACDWAEHVVPILERGSPKELRSVPDAVIRAKRRWLKKEIDTAKFDQDQRFILTVRERAIGTAAAHAAGAVLCMSDTHTSWKDVSTRAVAAAEWDSPSGVGYPDLVLRSKQAVGERLWQVRRVVHVTEALQSGMPWPPLEATK